MQSPERGRSLMSCACHWTVGVAARRAKVLYADVYLVAPACSFQTRQSSGPRIWPGADRVVTRSGQPLPTIQALEQYMPADKINLSFADGMLFHRLDQLIEGKAQASALFSGPYYFAEQLGFRKIIDTTFMIATMVTGDPDPEDLRKFFRALKRAQRDIDLRPDLYTHYYKNEFPARYHAMMDTRRWGPGEPLVFEPYTKRSTMRRLSWDRRSRHFADSGMGTGNYDEGSSARSKTAAASRIASRPGRRRACKQARLHARCNTTR
jgi:hypothetical protein